MQKLSREAFVSALQMFALVAATIIPTAVAAQSLDGIWRSQGYGFAFDVHGDEWNAFEVTSTTCVAGFTATRSGGPAADREATFTIGGRRPIHVRRGGSNDHKVLHFDGAASDVRIDRLSRMPPVCDRLTADTPANNFEVFARTWAEHYISFDLKHADWEKIVAAARPKVNAGTSPSTLFDILAGMIQPFGDAHTSISAPAINKVFRGFRPDSVRAQRSALEVTDRAYLKGALQEFCQGKIQYGHVDDAIGYLRILSFSGFSASGDFASGLEELETALDRIFSDFSDRALKALVIDVRVNPGGSDPFGLAIASRLATNEYLAYAKVARSHPTDREKWTARDESRVKPSTRPGFRGPVVELIGPSTVSAGETFTQALMGRTPHVTRIGGHTQGVFADVLGRRLPNGWTFGLPNEVFLTPEGTAFDGPGIPPDIQIPVFTASDLSAGKDPAMAKALEILASARRPNRWLIP